MNIKRTSLLLATSAIVGVTVASPAFAQVTDRMSNPITVAPLTTADTDLLLTSTSETITVTAATLAVGDATTMDGAAAIEATDSSAASTLNLNNTGAGVAVTIDSGDTGASIQKHADQDLHVNITSDATNTFDVTAANDINLGGGTLTLTSGGAALTTTVSGNTTAGLITLDSTAGDTGATFEGNVTAPLIAIIHEGGNAETLTFSGDDALAVSGDIIADDSGDTAGGDITVSGMGTAVTFHGNIGSTSVDLMTVTGVNNAQGVATLTVDAGNSATLAGTSAITDVTAAGDVTNSGTLTVGNDLTTSTGTFTNSGTLTVGNDLAGAGDVTNSGTATVTGAVTSTGTITNSGTLTVTGATSGASTFANTGTLVLNGANGATVNNAGVLDIRAPITNTGTIDLASAGSTTVDLAALTNGQTAIAGGTANVTGNTRVLLNPNLAMGDTVTIADNTAATTNGNLVANIANVTIANALNQVTVDTMTGAVVATVGAANTAAQTGAALGISTAEGSKVLSAGTDAVAGNFVAGLASFQTEIVNALTGTSAEAQAIAERLGDATASAGAVTDAAASTFASTNTNIGNRLASLRSGNAAVAAGNGASNQNMWFEATASTLDQDRRKGAAGFEVDSIGGTIGYDVEAGNGSHVGVAFGYNYADVDGDGAANADTEVDSYLLTLYGGKTYGDSFVNGSVHFGINDVDTTLTSDVRRSGNYSNEQYGAAVDFGRNVSIGENTRLVPSVGLSYTRIGSEDVTLRDVAGSAPNITDSLSSRDIFVGKIGARLENDHHTDAGGLVRSAVHANFLYDFASDEVTSIRNFGNNVTVQDEQAEISEETVNLGAAFTYESANRKTAVQLGYDVDLRDEFVGHTGSVRVSFRF